MIHNTIANSPSVALEAVPDLRQIRYCLPDSLLIRTWVSVHYLCMEQQLFFGDR
jgi:hypothetical protein